MSLRKLTRRVRRLPPLKYAVPQQLFMVSWQWAVALAAIYATPEVVVRLVQRLSPGTFSQFVPGAESEQSIGLLQAIVVCIAAALYGIGRLGYYHPRRREAYRLWLEQTPWTSRQPLPLGPAHLGWRDLFAMIALAGGALHAGPTRQCPPCC